MKILSSFDTKAATNHFVTLEEQYGTKNVLLIQKSKLFFYKYIGGKYCVFFVLFVVAMYGYYTAGTGLPAWSELGVRGLFALYLIAIVISTSAAWMNYRMDYLIVTPNEITFHDQRSLFADDIQSLRSDKIKSITYQKSGLIQSFFNVGTLHFLVEGEGERGDIKVDYVDAVEHTEKTIMRIISQDIPIIPPILPTTNHVI